VNAAGVNAGCLLVFGASARADGDSGPCEERGDDKKEADVGVEWTNCFFADEERDEDG
jgi:hypothetical protein